MPTSQAQSNSPAGAQDHNSSKKTGTRVLVTLLKLAFPMAILFAASLGYVQLKNAKPVPKKPKVVEKVWSVDVIKANAKTVIPTLHLYGKTVSRRQVELRALVAGKIIKTGPSLKEGALVKKGEMLVAIDDFDYIGAIREANSFHEEAIARAQEMRANVLLEQENLKFSQAQLSLAQKDFERAARLSKSGTVSQKLADDRKVILSQRAQSVSTHKVNLDFQRARLKGQTAVIDRLKWKVDQAKRRLVETKLIAPFDAYVNSVSAQIGRTVSVNDRIANLIDIDQIDVRFVLTDAQYGRIISHESTLIDRKITVNWKVGDKPINYSATIKRIGAEISSQAGGVEIYASIDTPKSPLLLRTGAFVEIKMDDREYEKVIQVPQTALYEGNTIYIIQNGELKPVIVKIVGTAGSDSLISANLPPNTQILSSRLSLAGEGVRVKSRTDSPTKPTKKPLKKPDATAHFNKGL